MFWKKKAEKVQTATRYDVHSQRSWKGPCSFGLVQLELIGRTVQAAFDIPLSQWREEDTQNSHEELYRATTKRGAVIEVHYVDRSIRLSVDGEHINSYHFSPIHSDSDNSGYIGLFQLHRCISNEMQRRRDALEQPSRMAREAELSRQQALQRTEADDRKKQRAADILNRL